MHDVAYRKQRKKWFKSKVALKIIDFPIFPINTIIKWTK